MACQRLRIHSHIDTDRLDQRHIIRAADLRHRLLGAKLRAQKAGKNVELVVVCRRHENVHVADAFLSENVRIADVAV